MCRQRAGKHRPRARAHGGRADPPRAGQRPVGVAHPDELRGLQGETGAGRPAQGWGGVCEGGCTSYV